uniref:Uncharacterized protein n=1 Tax=Cacopsylla melanoneura TaxID=428564 RepID=A0A8D8XVI9_9HEMI
MLNNNFTYRIEILLIQNCLYNDRLPTYALPTVANHDINRLPCYGRLKIDHGLMLSSSTPTIRRRGRRASINILQATFRSPPPNWCLHKNLPKTKNESMPPSRAL